MVHLAGRALTYFLDCSVVGSNPTQDFRVVLSAVDSYHQYSANVEHRFVSQGCKEFIIVLHTT